jgi:hypothetical protein
MLFITHALPKNLLVDRLTPGECWKTMCIDIMQILTKEDR